MTVSAHVQAQVLRFVRVSGYALAVQVAASGLVWPGWRAVWALVPGALETGLRQVSPVRPVETAPLAGPGGKGGVS